MKRKMRPRPPADESFREACPHRPPCPGCPRFGEPGIARQAHSKLEALASAQGLAQVAVINGDTRGFRLRGRLAIRGRLSTPKLGLFELGTHRVVHIPNCSVQHPLINRVANVVRPRPGRVADTELFGRGAPGARTISASRRRTQLANSAGGIGWQQCEPCAAEGLFRVDSRTPRRRSAQPMVQCALRAGQHHPRAAVRAYLRPRQRDRTFRRRGGALSTGCIRTEQSRYRPADHRTHPRDDPAGGPRHGVLCGRRRHRLIGARARRRHSLQRGGCSLVAWTYTRPCRP